MIRNHTPRRNPVVSIVVATYNSARTLRSCLDSLLKNIGLMPPGACQVVVPLRKSSDETKAILAEYPMCEVYEHELAGICNAHNQGISHAIGEYTVFLNSDDELSAGFIPRMVELAQLRGTKHVVYSSVLFINERGDPLYYRHPAPYFGWIQKHYSIILHPNAIYPADLLKRHLFEILPGNPPRDREQVYALMKEATWSRTRDVHYRFRVWNSSGTVVRAKSERVTQGLWARIVSLIGRALVQSYETQLLTRAIARRFGASSYWRKP